MTDRITGPNNLLDLPSLIKDPAMQAARLAPYLSIEQLKAYASDEVVQELIDMGLGGHIGAAEIKQMYHYSDSIEEGGPLVGKSFKLDDGNWYFSRTLGNRLHKGDDQTCPLFKSFRCIVSYFPKRKGYRKFKFYFIDDLYENVTGNHKNMIADIIASPNIPEHMESDDNSKYIAVWSICHNRSKLSSKLFTIDDIARALSTDAFYSALDRQVARYFRLSKGDFRNSGIEYSAYVSRVLHTHETFKAV